MIIGCQNKSEDVPGHYCRVPAVITNQGEAYEELTRERRRRWIAAISRVGLTDNIIQNDRVCFRHFVSGIAAKPWDQFNIDWIPTLNLGHNKKGENVEAVGDRAERTRQRRKRLEESMEEEVRQKLAKPNEPGETITEIFHEAEFEDHCEVSSGDKDVGIARSQDSESQQHQDQSTQTEEFDYVFKEKRSLSNNAFSMEYFCQDDGKVRFYTGLPSYDVLKATYEFVSPRVTRNSLSTTKFQGFILVLIKLRLNVPHQDLAYRFNISLTTVSRILSHWLLVMDVCLTPMISWPERADLWKTMPQSFKYSFGNKVTAIIDCFEVFIDRPSNLLARAQTFSSYKHHNTAKVLIGITPQGTISFVSNSWGGRTSDKYLTQNCGILGKLLPGDLILADRGFTIQESVWYHKANINIPAFTRGKDQLDPVDVEKTRGIANVRIHVERVIGSLRQKYTILQSTLPTDYLTCSKSGHNEEKSVPLLDRIIRVCSALVNLCPAIVPFD